LGSVNGPANNILRIYRGGGASNYSEITNIGGTTYVRANGITGVAASLELQTKQDDWADFCSRLTIVGNGIACFACQVCAPAAIFSGCVGIGNTSPSEKLTVDGNILLGGDYNLAIDVTTNGNGKVGRTDRAYLQINRSNFEGFLSFHTTSTGAGGLSERLRITSTGISCFANTVCSPRFVGPLTGNLNGFAIRAQASCILGGSSSDVTIYFTSNIFIEYGVNDYTVGAYNNDNSAIFSSLRALIPYNYYQSTVTTTNLASYIDGANGHSALSIAVCKLVNSNTYCIAVRFAVSAGNVFNKGIIVTSNGIQTGFA
jgi:hypothetical protein